MDVAANFTVDTHDNADMTSPYIMAEPFKMYISVQAKLNILSLEFPFVNSE